MTVFCGQHGATAHLSAESRMSEDFFYYSRHFRSLELKEDEIDSMHERMTTTKRRSDLCVGQRNVIIGCIFLPLLLSSRWNDRKETQQSTDLKYMSGKKIYHTMCRTRRKIINLLLILFSFPFPKAKADTNIYWIKKIERAKRS